MLLKDVRLRPRVMGFNPTTLVDLRVRHFFPHARKVFHGVPAFYGTSWSPASAMVLQEAGYLVNQDLRPFTHNVWNQMKGTFNLVLKVPATTSLADVVDFQMKLNDPSSLHYIRLDLFGAPLHRVHEFRDEFPNTVIIAGPVCDPELAGELFQRGADMVETGGFDSSSVSLGGLEPLTGMELDEVALCTECVGDTMASFGFSEERPGDAVKALALGASFVNLAAEVSPARFQRALSLACTLNGSASLEGFMKRPPATSIRS